MNIAGMVAGGALCMLSLMARSDEIYLNDIDWPPFFMPQNSNGLPGLGKEVLTYCLSDMGYQVQFRNLPVKRTHVYMRNGELDLSVYSYKKDREEFVEYGREPIFVSEYGLAVRADSDIQISRLADLSNYRFGHLAGLAHTPELSALIAKKRERGEVQDAFSLNMMFSQLLSTTPRFDIMANSKETFYWRSASLGISDKIRVLDYTLASKPYYVTVSRSSNVIQQTEIFLFNVDQCLRRLRKSGMYAKISEKYGLRATIPTSNPQ